MDESDLPSLPSMPIFQTQPTDDLDEVDLPPIPPLLPFESSLIRKRPRLDYEPTTSSDPALFSSDDQNPSAENYAAKRRKERYAGTWWGARSINASNERRRPFRRNYDSGIHMGSEGTESSLEDEFLQDMDRKRQETVAENERRFTRLADAEDVLEKLPKPMLVSPVHHQVRRIIQQCLEQGNENVDLSSMSLTSLPPDISSLKSLTRLSRLPSYTMPSPSQESEPRDVTNNRIVYTSIESDLRLYLANNSFVQVPSMLLDLTNLRFLSLRQNKLTGIPPGIRQLVNLQTLNVSGNKLNHLPVEVLELVQSHCLTELILHPNPWTSSPASATQIAEPVVVKHQHLSTTTKCEAVGVLETLRANGTIDRRPTEFLDTAVNTNNSQCHSLAELVLRRISKLQGLTKLEEWMSEEFPEAVQGMLATAQELDASGGRICTTCGQSFILARKQWIEWWTMDLPQGNHSLENIPFLRQQCRIRCEKKPVDHTYPIRTKA